ncbi:MAG: hypothetical protein ACI91T_002042 [Natronomonas sp.]|jgi:hypothetical protein
MRTSPLSAIAVVALLVFAGCTGLPGTGENQPSPDASPADFPKASAINGSVFDTHTTALANTSFTLTIERTRKESDPTADNNFTYKNTTSRFLVEPGASQYLVHTTGVGDWLGPNRSTYSNGRTVYMLSWESNQTKMLDVGFVPVFNESGDQYLWRGFFDNDSGNWFEHAAIDATFQRKGIETFQGVPVMRYEATGIDALSDSSLVDENASRRYEEFSATLLLDEDGVIRYYEYEFILPVFDYRPRRIAVAYTLSDVGSTDVEKPDWVANATAGS